MLTFEPGERHRIESEHGAQVILILSSWPGEGHDSEGRDSASEMARTTLSALRATRDSSRPRNELRGPAHADEGQSKVTCQRGGPRSHTVVRFVTARAGRRSSGW